MSNSRPMQTIAGLATARGLASGPVFVYRGSGSVPVPEYQVGDGHEGEEILRLQRACADARRDIENLIQVLRERTNHADVMVFECHLMMLEDPVFCGEIERLIREGHLNAEAAVRRAADQARAAFGRMNDDYFRSRVRDLDDVERRLHEALAGRALDIHLELKVPSVIVADDLTPSEAILLPKDLVLGFATDGGSTTSHVALLARALGIPAVTGLGNATELVTAGENVLLDGTSGTLTLHPTAAAVREFDDFVRRQRALATFVSDRPAGTLVDGGEIRLEANMHDGVPFRPLAENGARGIGLYRSEYLWLNRKGEPTEDEQYAAYRAAAEAVRTLGDGAHVTLRALDIGGDKTVEGISRKEENPFLGNRSIRYLLSHRDVLRAQFRAVLRASAAGRVRLMLPMVACVDELLAAQEELARIRAELTRAGIAFDPKMPVGAMIEVPAAALDAERLAAHVDFFSIGTNDLVQYAMAADRGNDSVAYLYQPTSFAVLRLVEMTVAAARTAGIPVSVCGESASDPIVGTLWAALGVDALSMSPAYIPVMARIFAALTRADLADYGEEARAVAQTKTAAETYVHLRAWLAGKIPACKDLIS